MMRRLMMNKKRKYNHAFDIAFEIESDNKGEHVTRNELIQGLTRRLVNPMKHPTEIIEACGLPFDTYLIEED